MVTLRIPVVRTNSASGAFWKVPASLVASLAGLGLVVSLTVTPSVFIIDDLNYLVTVLAARGGHVTVANTEGLTPSRELLFFDPAAPSRIVRSTPVSPATPPLYGPIAVPFSLMGWRGLVALNTLAYLTTIWLVFVYTRRYAAKSSTPWLAAAAFALGGYALEYAQGVWPHALSVALCTGGIVAAGRMIDGGRIALAMLAGGLLGVAAGVRYQNVVIVVAVAAAVLLLAPRRWRAAALFALGALVPIAATSLINHVRLDSWNPISKGPGYLNVPIDASLGQLLGNAVTMFWAQFIDYSVRPPLPGLNNLWLTYGSVSGAHLILGETVKKAFLQSAPWAVLGVMMFVLCWRRRADVDPRRQRQLRLLSVVVVAEAAVFSIVGLNRHDGLSFNARYLLELLPLAGVAFAWSLDALDVPLQGVGPGILVGWLVALAVLSLGPAGAESSLPTVLRNVMLLKIPLVLAGGLATLWWLKGGRLGVQLALVWAVGVSLGWGLSVHVLEDVVMSYRLRAANQTRQVIYQNLPDNSALVVYWANTHGVGPLLLSRDVVVLDAHADGGEAAPVLIRELKARGRRVFLFMDGFPAGMLQSVIEHWRVIPMPGDVPAELVELSLEENDNAAWRQAPTTRANPAALVRFDGGETDCGSQPAGHDDLRHAKIPEKWRSFKRSGQTPQHWFRSTHPAWL